MQVSKKVFSGAKRSQNTPKTDESTSKDSKKKQLVGVKRKNKWVEWINIYGTLDWIFDRIIILKNISIDSWDAAGFKPK